MPTRMVGLVFVADDDLWLLLAILVVRSVVLFVQSLVAMQYNAVQWVQLGVTDLIPGAVSETPTCGVLLLSILSPFWTNSELLIPRGSE